MRFLRQTIDLTRLHKVILVLWAISLGAAGFALLDIPRALYENDPGFLTDPDQLSLIISQAVAVSILVPLAAVVVNVLRSDASSEAQRSTTSSGEVVPSRATNRVPKWLVALLLVLAILRGGRKRNAGH